MWRMTLYETEALAVNKRDKQVVNEGRSGIWDVVWRMKMKYFEWKNYKTKKST